MAIRTVQESSLTSIANAIRTKGGTSAQLEFPDEFVYAIQNIPTGGGGAVEPKDVNFYDYDGTLTNSYTAAEFSALSAMPANPTHTGLTAQGWNWSLANAKTYVTKYGKLNIGQMYVTTSGDTEIDIQLGIGRNKPYLGCCPNGTVDIDWGDGSAHDTLTGTSTSTLKYIQHTYPDTGEMFTITLHMESGELGFVGDSVSGSQVLYNGTTLTTNGQYTYHNAVKKVCCGSHVTSIGDSAFGYCYSLASVTIPEGVTSIGGSAFRNCASLVSVTIPEGVTSIGTYAFNNCYSLASVMIPKGVTSIDTYAFYNCYLLSSVTIPEGVTSIGGTAFRNCASLVSVTIPEGVTSIGGSAFYNCYSLASVMIPKGVTSIDTYAFYNCYLLSSVTIPEGVTSIGGTAFRNCTSLVSVTIPEGVTSIGGSAFYMCSLLASVTIPEGVTSIGGSAFASCSSLKYLIFESTTPPTVSNADAFNSLSSDLVVYVPAGTLSAYQAASNYTYIKNYMVEMSA